MSCIKQTNKLTMTYTHTCIRCYDDHIHDVKTVMHANQQTKTQSKAHMHAYRNMMTSFKVSKLPYTQTNKQTLIHKHTHIHAYRPIVIRLTVSKLPYDIFLISAVVPMALSCSLCPSICIRTTPMTFRY